MYLLVGCIENENRADFLQLRTCFCEHTLHTMQCPPAHTVQATTTPCTHHQRRDASSSPTVSQSLRSSSSRSDAPRMRGWWVAHDHQHHHHHHYPHRHACGTQSTVQCSQLCARPHIMTINKQKTGFIQKCVTLIFRPNCIQSTTTTIDKVPMHRLRS